MTKWVKMDGFTSNLLILNNAEFSWKRESSAGIFCLNSDFAWKIEREIRVFLEKW